jgi:mannose-6-phosphate isomerase-like protein (cupin superfamily)
MKNPDDYMNSGMLELFVMGMLTKEESIEVETMAALHPEIRDEIAVIEDAQEEMAKLAALHPPSRVKTKLLNAIEEVESQTKLAGNPPFLSRHSKVEDFNPWVKNPDNVAPKEYEDPFFIPLVMTAEETIALVWIRENIPSEVHTDVIEKLFILEGSCDVEFGGQVYSLKAGDFLRIPLHVAHKVTITSKIPCKLIVERLAA